MQVHIKLRCLVVCRSQLMSSSRFTCRLEGGRSPQNSQVNFCLQEEVVLKQGGALERVGEVSSVRDRRMAR